MTVRHGEWNFHAAPPLLQVELRGAVNLQGAQQHIAALRAVLLEAPEEYRVMLVHMEQWLFSTNDAPDEFQQFHYWLADKTAVRDCLYIIGGQRLKRDFIELGWPAHSPIRRHYLSCGAQSQAVLQEHGVVLASRLAAED